MSPAKWEALKISNINSAVVIKCSQVGQECEMLLVELTQVRAPEFF